MRILGTIFVLLAAIALSIAPTLPASAQNAARTALAVGNGACASAPLANAVNDAADMAAALKGLGFEVILTTDADQRAMEASGAQLNVVVLDDCRNNPLQSSGRSAARAMRWTIGQSVHTGAGVLDGGIFTVDWGQPSPVRYGVGDDGSLTDLWAGGRGNEGLTPPS